MSCGHYHFRLVVFFFVVVLVVVLVVFFGFDGVLFAFLAGFAATFLAVVDFVVFFFVFEGAAFFLTGTLAHLSPVAGRPM